MKKQLLKLTLFVAVLFIASATQAQAILWTKDAIYRIGARGTTLFMTIDGTTTPVSLKWAEEITTGDASTQEFAIVGHRTPAAAGLMEITANVGGNVWTMCIDPTTVADYPNVTLTVEQRLPKEVEEADWSGLDQFQRRKAKVDANGDPDAAGSNPAGAVNNALFVQAGDALKNSRYGVIPSAAGDLVQFDGGGIDVIDYHFVRDLPTASVKSFSADAFTISNPVNNFLNISGETSKINKVNVYSILGGKMLSRKIDNQNNVSINVNNLASGLYIVELVGESSSFTKKIVKQ
ncbi:T9SS type A sorting domain-containing protein [uncultured Polaribacter sp.]|uniref:T9SS type A sorting domain-containing protein n=1 Tax=uncultured Polaribacter sp. TaxID=174711 RepID=UPI0026279BDA|nr:T9SS type A sorting domain-containing protein [uncultured Polaribacter sp.]